jgi:glucose/arabinose dehydrogenase
VSRSNARAVLAVIIALASSNFAHAVITGMQQVATGLSAPIFVTHAPGDTSRLFIALRGGTIRILNLQTGVLEATPFLSMSGISTTGEGGFLGLAFHPNYFNSGQPGFRKFYVDVTTDSTTITHIREFEVSAGNPNVANTAFREILNMAQPQTNHKGGWIGFSPNDGNLYIATGDGGGGNDTGTGHTTGTGNAQDITANLLGKMLRIDPTGDDFPGDTNRNYAIPLTNPMRSGVGIPADDVGDDEIWAYGLRNPFRDSFDRLTGDLWIGDVGQGAREEVDFQPASSPGGENYGWRLREGAIATPTSGIGGTCTGCIEPVYDYDRDADQFGGVVITGGYVYRGADPSLHGKYLFLDSRNSNGVSDDNYWMFDPANPRGTVQNIDTLVAPGGGSRQFPVSFGEDAYGNLYVAYLGSGEVFRIVTNQIPEPCSIVLVAALGVIFCFSSRRIGGARRTSDSSCEA